MENFTQAQFDAMNKTFKRVFSMTPMGGNIRRLERDYLLVKGLTGNNWDSQATAKIYYPSGYTVMIDEH